MAMISGDVRGDRGGSRAVRGHDTCCSIEITTREMKRISCWRDQRAGGGRLRMRLGREGARSVGREAGRLTAQRRRKPAAPRRSRPS